jgi:hypothetical protein
MRADTAELTYEAMLSDPLIMLVMRSDGVTHDQLVAVLRDAAVAVQARAELLPMRRHLALVHSAPPKPAPQPALPRSAAQTELQLRLMHTGT